MPTMEAVRQYLAGKDKNGRQIRPPVIPEIAKAYQNDPRTQLATQAMAQGSSSAPVATGKYAYADGIARALTGVIGGYQQRKSEQQYRGDEDTLLAARAARGQEGITGMGAPPSQTMPTGGPPPAPPVASQIAAALQGPQPPQGAPAPGSGGPALPPVPPVPSMGGQPGGGNPFPVSSAGSISLASGADALKRGGATITSGYRTPEHNAAVGGVPNSYHTQGSPSNPQAYDFTPRPGETMAQLEARARVAFPGFDVLNEGDHVHVEPSRRMAGGPAGGSMVASTPPPPAPPSMADITRPVAEPVSDLPMPMARPTAPQAVAANKSPLLKAAYGLMIGANPYESAAAQSMYERGLTEQGDLNEAATGREQALRNAGYQSDLGIYATQQSQAGAAQIADRAATIKNNRDEQSDYEKYLRDADEKEKDRRERLAAASLRTATGGASTTWNLTQDEEDALSLAAAEGRVDVSKLNTRTAKIQARVLLRDTGIDLVSNHGDAVLAGNAPARRNAALVSQMPEIIANVRDAGKKLNFSDVQFVGKLQAWGKGQLNDPAFAEYMTQRNDAMQTLAQVMSGVGATDMRTKMESEAAPKSMSPSAWEGWFRGQISALTPRIRNAEANKLLAPGTADKLLSEAGIAPAAATGSGGWGKATVVGH